MMLRHIGQHKPAERIQNAWLKTLEDGIHTADIYNSKTSTKKATTTEFTDAVIARFGLKPKQLPAVDFSNDSPTIIPELILSRTDKRPGLNQKRVLKGTDVFVYWEPDNPDKLAEMLRNASSNNFELSMITNRGTKVWPNGLLQTFCTDHWRFRFKTTNGKSTSTEIVDLLGKLSENSIDVVKTENLYEFDGQAGYSLGQGE